jgi:hypothetical protein
MLGGPAAVEQYGEGLCGEVDAQVEHGGQDLMDLRRPSIISPRR